MLRMDFMSSIDCKRAPASQAPATLVERLLPAPDGRSGVTPLGRYIKEETHRVRRAASDGAPLLPR